MFANNNITILENEIAGNGYGISTGYMPDAANNDISITGNRIHHNMWGIQASGNNIDIVGNHFEAHAYGSVTGRPQNLAIYNNNFAGNNSTAWPFGSSHGIEVNPDNTSFNDPAAPYGGNYFSDFDTPGEGCDDTNSDGFCDDAYVLMEWVTLPWEPVHTVEVDNSWTAPYGWDTASPGVDSVSPSGEVDGAPGEITVTYSDAALSSGIDTDSINVTLDGSALSGCSVTASQAVCPVAGLDIGSHDIGGSVSDFAGNTSSIAGDFDIVDNSVAPPFGSLDWAGSGGLSGQPGAINLSGWAIDPDTGNAAVDINVYVNGQLSTTLIADNSRPDIGAAYPSYGDQHGFAGSVKADSASNNVCAFAINTGPGDDTLLGCRTVTVPVNPVGSLDSVSATSKISLSGWAFDPETADPIDVHVYVNGQFKGSLTADAGRNDIGAIFPGYGDNHGFSGEVDAVSSGNNIVCVYGINDGLGSNVLLGCKSVNVQVNPFGNLDGVSVDGASGKINVGGWAIDPNAGTGSIEVHFYVNGVYKGPLTADQNRPDIGAAFPAYGENHGFSGQVNNAGTGNNTVCAYGINTGAGGNVLLGCKTVNVPGGNPFGSLDGVSAGNNGKINVGGWAIDPNAGIGSIDVHFYVNGVYRGPLTADQSRPDLAPFFPGYGTDHGFSGQIDAVATSNTVCAYGINTGPGGNVLLGCKSVNVQVNPFGNLDGVSVDGASGKINVGGWAIDPNAGTGPIDVHFYVNGVYKGPLTADQNRPDIGAAFPAYGENHGFSGQVNNAGTGNNTVCAYGINTGAGGNVLLGCKTVNVPGGNPFGNLDRVSIDSKNTILLSGWAIDPNAGEDSIDVQVLVNQQPYTVQPASNDRPDLGAIFPYGPGHGFYIELENRDPNDLICVIMLNTGPGQDINLGCRIPVPLPA